MVTPHHDTITEGQAARAHAPGHDPDRVGHDFARWIRNKGGRLDAPEITASFETFAKGYDAVQGRSQQAPVGWDGPAERERSPYSDFPRIRDTLFAGLVSTHAPAADPDTIGQAFAVHLRGVGVPFELPDAVSHEEDVVSFCQTWQRARTPVCCHAINLHRNLRPYTPRNRQDPRAP